LSWSRVLTASMGKVAASAAAAETNDSEALARIPPPDMAPGIWELVDDAPRSRAGLPTSPSLRQSGSGRMNICCKKKNKPRQPVSLKSDSRATLWCGARHCPVRFVDVGESNSGMRDVCGETVVESEMVWTVGGNNILVSMVTMTLTIEIRV
jgi:hypothetical protein